MPLAVGEELLVDSLGVESGHRAGRQTQRPHGEDEVAGLKGGLKSPVCLRIGSFASNTSRSSGRNGSSAGMWSWKRGSTARTATAGAEAVFALFPSFICSTSRARPSSVRTNRTRSGCVLAAVGAQRASSQICASSSSLTGVGAKLFAVRASV